MCRPVKTSCLRYDTRSSPTGNVKTSMLLKSRRRERCLGVGEGRSPQPAYKKEEKTNHGVVAENDFLCYYSYTAGYASLIHD